MATGARSCYSTFSGTAQDSRNRGEGLRGPPLVRNPFEFLIVPGFVRAEALSALNRDFPLIDDPGNVSPDGLRSGPAFAALLGELGSGDFATCFGAKFGIDLSSATAVIAVRRNIDREGSHPARSRLVARHAVPVIKLLPRERAGAA
jgi:hypothetical protein